MIRDTLIPELVRRFAGLGLCLGDAPDPIASIPAKHADVGDVMIYDDGDEATVAIGKIFHDHFNPYDESLSTAQRDQFVTKAVVDFLNDFFADRILLWVSKSGQSAGLISLNGPPKPEDLSDVKQYAAGEALVYLWSGPVDLS